MIDFDWGMLRIKRNTALKSTDWTQLPDASLTEAQRQAWAAYRQALRDLPANTTDPRNVAWPERP